MPGKKLPDNWDQDTQFDGPEHWGMDERWKKLFPKNGVRADDSSSSSSGSSRGDSSGESDSDNDVRAKATVDARKDEDRDANDDDDDDDFGMLSSEDDSHDVTSVRVGVARAPRKIPESAPAPPGDGLGRRMASSNRPSSRPSKSNSNSGGSSKARSRRWRHGTKNTEPASSSRVDRRVRPRPESGTPQSVARQESRYQYQFENSSSEGEEEFDESEANITGHERSPTLTTTNSTTTASTSTPRRRKGRKGGGRIGASPSSAERSSGDSSGKEKGKGRAASPLVCDSSDSSDGFLRSLSPSGGGLGEDDEIESIGSESEDGGSSNCGYESSAAGSSGNEGHRSGSGRGSKESRRRSLSSPSPSHTSSRGKGKRPTHKKGGVLREGGRRDREVQSRGSSSEQSRGKGSKASTSSSTPAVSAERERHAGGGASKRPTQSGSKKVRKTIPAKGDEHGWISKGGGGGARGRSNPVASFQGSQSAFRKNQERNLTQSKINFPVVLDD